MEELLERIAKCVELGKINEKTPYPPAMKGQPGADELTLADMNEASAQYLSLQTRQQLALNSLSLAAQSAQSVLSLFN